MNNYKKPFSQRLPERLVPILIGLPWLEIVASAWKTGSKLFRGLAHEGMYEVLSYQSTLELKDNRGEKAVLQKNEKVCYLQNNILAFQDQAWGEGKILQGYRCSPGVAVDFYRAGHKTLILISLREVKHRGDEDNFIFEWGIRNGFLRDAESWETEVSHRTKQLKIQVIFPKERPPKSAVLIEGVRRRSHEISHKNKKRLPDGRWRISWKTSKPRLYERYIIKWEW